MESSITTHPNQTTLEDLVSLLTLELDGALRVFTSLEAPTRLAELLDRCFKASALAKATQTVLARSA